MGPLDTVGLTPLMHRTSGRAEIAIGLIDGPLLLEHPDLAGQKIREIRGVRNGSCSRPASMACLHGTFVAGILSARRGSAAPAICPGCTLLVRPIFSESVSDDGGLPSATAEDLARAILDCVSSGARVINMSAAVALSSAAAETDLVTALDYAAARGAIPVVAAGNEGVLGSSVLTRHPAAIPVAACDFSGKLLAESNLGRSIGLRGLRAPGVDITSLGTNGTPRTLGGTSAAAPFVTGTIGLLWSEFPDATANLIRLAVTQATARRFSIAPPLLNAWAAYQAMKST